MMGMYSFDRGITESGGTDIISLINPLLNGLDTPVYMFPMPYFEDIRVNIFNDILSPPIDSVIGIYLEPYNPETNEAFETYMEWYELFGYLSPIEGIVSNSLNGYNIPLGSSLNLVYKTRHWPMKVFLESVNMFEFEITTFDEPIDLIGFKIDFSGLPEAVESALKRLQQVAPSQQTRTLLTKNQKGLSQFSEFNYVGNYKNIYIPLLAFQSRLGLLAWGHVKKETKNSDVTNDGKYPNLEHIDVFTGFNEDKISRKALDCLNRRIN